jgi:hypothetical protein
VSCGRSTGGTPLTQLLQIRNVVLDPPVDLPQLTHNLRIVLQVFQLPPNGLLDVILERKHIGDVAVNGFVLIPGHVNLQI